MWRCEEAVGRLVRGSSSTATTLPIEFRTGTSRAEGMYQVLMTCGVSEIGVTRRR